MAPELAWEKDVEQFDVVAGDAPPAADTPLAIRDVGNARIAPSRSPHRGSPGTSQCQALTVPMLSMSAHPVGVWYLHSMGAL